MQKQVGSWYDVVVLSEGLSTADGKVVRGKQSTAGYHEEGAAVPVAGCSHREATPGTPVTTRGGRKPSRSLYTISCPRRGQTVRLR